MIHPSWSISIDYLIIFVYIYIYVCVYVFVYLLVEVCCNYVDAISTIYFNVIIVVYMLYMHIRIYSVSGIRTLAVKTLLSEHLTALWQTHAARSKKFHQDIYSLVLYYYYYDFITCYYMLLD